jgi:hypothetical protein
MGKPGLWQLDRLGYGNGSIIHRLSFSTQAINLYLPNQVRFRMVTASLAGLNTREEFIIRAVSGSPVQRGCGLDATLFPLEIVITSLPMFIARKYYPI